MWWDERQREADGECFSDGMLSTKGVVRMEDVVGREWASDEMR